MRGLLVNTGLSGSGVGNYTGLITTRAGFPIDLLNFGFAKSRSSKNYPTSSSGGTSCLVLGIRPEIGALRVFARAYRRSLLDALQSLSPTYDFIHIASQDLATTIPIFREIFRRPVILTVHDTGAFRARAAPYLMVIHASLLRAHLADAIMTDSVSAAQDLHRVNRLCSSINEVVPLGVDDRIFYPRDRLQSRRALDLPEGATLVLSVGRDWYSKNIQTTLRSFSDERCRNCFLVRVGPFEYSSATYESLPPEVRRRIIVRSDVHDRELPFYYSASDVLVFPSLKEGFGLEILEAALCGTPIVTTDRDPMNSIAPDLSTLVRDPTDSIEVAKAIVSSVEPPHGRSGYLAEASSVRQKHGTEAFFQAYKRVVNRALHRGDVFSPRSD